MNASYRKELFVKFIFIACQIFIGGIFIYAGLLKIIDPETFSMDIENYRILPRILVNLPAIYLPYLEVIVGLAIIFSPRKIGSLIIYNGLMVFFLFGIIQAVFRGLDIECGCFGSASRTVGLRVIAEDLLLLIIGVLLLVREFKKDKISQIILKRND